MAENILTSYFGATTPAWMRNSTVTAVTFGPNFSDYETAAQGEPLSPLAESDFLPGP